MITAVDTNVLLDIFSADLAFGPVSKSRLADCARDGQLLLSDVAWAETAAYFTTPEEAEKAITGIGIVFSPLTSRAANQAAVAWQQYRRAGGSRTRVIPDFLIGAHALVCADRLLTRDQGFFRKYFAELEIIDPSQNQHR